ncbi:hypothetical protein RS130_19185 [Paraglaciecola aquimarina]|uniref:Uncharacterized protein n=1 Tax=Paraglaciecola aquimarina TaxID=1235557 RepID=A0ABU3T0L3_9ALTE|nr:hypothetical protein [Paraglaciecola aquimarina]MDU0355722.1 hypothetical protein [Paraglaciecola aquimarina]
MAKLANKNDKVLIIRMLAAADVCAIGLPAIRFFMQQLPGADIHFLTFNDDIAKIISASEPNVHMHTLSAEQWPDDFFKPWSRF